jgi:hypothetical protein
VPLTGRCARAARAGQHALHTTPHAAPQADLSMAAGLGMSLERRMPLSNTEDFRRAVEAFTHKAKRPHFKGR